MVSPSALVGLEKSTPALLAARLQHVPLFLCEEAHPVSAQGLDRVSHRFCPASASHWSSSGWNVAAAATVAGRVVVLNQSN